MTTEQLPISYVWHVSSMERWTSSGIVFALIFEVTASDETYETKYTNRLEFEPPDPDVMIPYEELTQDIALQWVYSTLGDVKVTKIETELKVQIESMRAPQRAWGTPWVV